MSGAKSIAQVGIKTITVGSDKFAFLEIMQALRRNELGGDVGRSTLFEQRC